MEHATTPFEPAEQAPCTLASDATLERSLAACLDPHAHVGVVFK